MIYKPTFEITNKIIELISEISINSTKVIYSNKINSNQYLKKENIIRTIYSTLAIDKCSLSFEEVFNIINGQNILGPVNEIKEVKNAFDVYSDLSMFNPYTVEDLLHAHKLLMAGLVNNPGEFRNGSVGTFDWDISIQLAPDIEFVSTKVFQLFDWIKETDTHPLIKSIIFHYELEAILPFMDGNGKIGRLWRTLILSNWQDVLSWVPVDKVIEERQKDYYNILSLCSKLENSTKFIEFTLNALNDSLKEFIIEPSLKNEYVDKLLNVIGNNELSLKEIMVKLNLKSRQSFIKTYLNPALIQGLIEMSIPNVPNSKNQKYRKR